MVASLPGAPHWDQGPPQAEAAEPNAHGATNLHFCSAKVSQFKFFCRALCLINSEKSVTGICKHEGHPNHTDTQKAHYPHTLHFCIANSSQVYKPVLPVLTFSQQGEFHHSTKRTVRCKKYNDLRVPVLNNSHQILIHTIQKYSARN